MLEKVIIKNFKSVRSAEMVLTDLTVITGRNSDGKSIVIDALRFLHSFLCTVYDGLEWETLPNFNDNSSELEIEIHGKLGRDSFNYSISLDTTRSRYFEVTSEMLKKNDKLLFSVKCNGNDKQGETTLLKEISPCQIWKPLLSNKQMCDQNTFISKLFNYIKSWQFVIYDFEKGICFQNGEHGLLNSSQNMAVNIDEKSSDYLKNGLEYALNTKFQFFKEYFNSHSYHRSYYSAGIRRLINLLLLLNKNEKDIFPTLFIDEIENGLDPQVLNFLISEIQSFLPHRQFVVTTNSPFFLDLIDVRHVVIAEWIEDSTRFRRPLIGNKWNKEFSCGDLYLMGRL